MLIHRLVLNKYVRLMLREISYFEYRPTHVHQLIIGGNGSGKSSVMHELSPLPADRDDYLSGGYKLIELTHGNQDYVIRSDFKERSAKHSFVCAGEELNPGGTATVQKALVLQHFSLTPELFEVLIGETRFTAMAPLKRRDWIIALSGNDLDFAMGLFSQLKQSVAETKGAVKHINRRLTEEQTKTMPADQLTELQTRCGLLKDELHHILEHMKSGLPSDRQAWGALNEQMQSLAHHARAVLLQDIRMPAGYAFDGLESVQAAAWSHEAEIGVLMTQLNDRHREYAELQRVVELVGQETVDLDQLQSRFAECRQEQQRIEGTVPEWYFTIETLNRAEHLYGVMDTLYPQLHEIYSEMPDNSDKRYTRELMEQVRASIVTMSTERNQHIGNLAKIEHRLEHFRTADTQKCPSCAYIWKPGVGEMNVEEMTAKAAELDQRVKAIDAHIFESNEYLDCVNEYLRYRKRFNQIVSNAPSELHMLWREIASVEAQGVSPKAVLTTLDVWRLASTNMLSVWRIGEEMAQLEMVIQCMQGHQSSDNVASRHERMGQEIEITTQRVEQLKRETAVIRDYETRVSRFLKQLPMLEQMVQEFDSRYNTCVRSIRNTHLTTMMSERQSTLAHAEVALSTAKSVVDVIADLQRDADRTTLELAAYQALMEELSPVDGLIADQLHEFIACFTDEINSVIDRIWTSPLQLQACGMDSGELDWRFPLRVGTSGLTPDASKGSKGQQEIVDFAFKLVTVLYLGLNDMPLYLDELAPGLDELHRNNIMVFVKQYVEARQCTQLMMISHYNESYGMFSNAEVCVLDPRNIVHLPDCVNQHVITH